MPTVNQYLANPQWIRQEIKVKEYRMRETLKIVKEILNDNVSRANQERQR